MNDIQGYVPEHGLAEKMFRLAVEACPNGMVMIDGDGIIVMVNSEIENQFGYTRQELIGNSVDMLVPAPQRTQHGHHRHRFVDKTGKQTPETRRMGAGRNLFGLRKDGSQIPVEVSLNPIHDGGRLLVLGVIVDISQRKDMERLKDEFVSTVSHELRTPLTSISGSLGLLVGQWSGHLPEQAVRLLKIAHNNSQRLTRLINDILDIEKFESGRVVFNFARVGAISIVEQAIEDNRGLALSASVDVLFDPTSLDAEVNADPDRLTQVITNLLSNAIKFSLGGDKVVVGVARHGDLVRISVRDHGPGIPAEFKQHVFEKFAQADGTSSKQKGGTGLGLNIVEQIMERLGGQVGFRDADGGGTVFHVDLPIWDGAAGGELDVETDASCPRILLCDDDRAIAKTVRTRLRQAGFAVDFALTINSALARANAVPYAAVLVDLRIRQADGIDLILQLRAMTNYRNTPIVVLAGDLGRGQGDVRADRLNVLDWFSKPIDFGRLVEVLKAATVVELRERPRILHVDDDYDVLTLVMHGLRPIADVISTDTLDSARRVLATDRIDLAILDIALGETCGLDLLPDLHDSLNVPIPVIVFSAFGADDARSQQIEAAFSKTSVTLENLVASVRDRLALLPAHASRGIT